MGWPRTLVLVRHAESVGNIMSVDERAGYDVAPQLYELTPRGRRQAAITGAYLKERFGNFDVRYVSYYSRANETMRIIYPDFKVYEDPRLAEANRGIWHSMTREQMLAKYPEEVARKDREGLYHYRPWGGENWPDIELRIHSFLGTLNRDYDGRDVMIVVHGHWLILFERLIEHFSVEEAVRRYQEKVVENASVTVYRGCLASGRSRLVRQEYVIPWEGQA